MFNLLFKLFWSVCFNFFLRYLFSFVFFKVEVFLLLFKAKIEDFLNYVRNILVFREYVLLKNEGRKGVSR